jgi:hypothetical protein
VIIKDDVILLVLGNKELDEVRGFIKGNGK